VLQFPTGRIGGEFGEQILAVTFLSCHLNPI
jgi:hypothetical protein